MSELCDDYFWIVFLSGYQMKKFTRIAPRTLLLLVTLCTFGTTHTYFASDEKIMRLEAILLERGHENFLNGKYVYVSTSTTNRDICLLTKDCLTLHERYFGLTDDELFTLLVKAENTRIMKDGLQAVVNLLAVCGMWWGFWHFCVIPSMQKQRCEIVLLQPAKTIHD